MADSKRIRVVHDSGLYLLFTQGIIGWGYTECITKIAFVRNKFYTDLKPSYLWS